MEPLVDPGPALSAAELARYSRHVILPGIGLSGQRRLTNARVLVIGAGGLGAPVLMYLAAAGVGTLGVLDDDVVEESNLQRQVIYGQSDLRRPKVDSAADRIAELNPYVRVRTHRARLESSNALDVLRGYDLVIDGSDNFPTRYLVSDACEMLALPVVWGSIFQFDGQATVFWSGHGPTYRDLFPAPAAPGTVPSCAEAGVFGVLCAAIGAVMGTEAVKLICGVGEPLLGRLVVFDALAMSWREIRVRPVPGREPVTRLIDYDHFCAVADPQRAHWGGAVPHEQASIDVQTLKARLQARARGEDDFLLVDVRQEYERQIVSIPGAVHIPLADLQAPHGLDQIPAGRRVVVHCKSGARSAQALQILHSAGRTDAVHVAGGVLAWVREIDPTQPSY